jgi:hypothetical protein
MKAPEEVKRWADSVTVKPKFHKTESGIILPGDVPKNEPQAPRGYVFAMCKGGCGARAALRPGQQHTCAQCHRKANGQPTIPSNMLNRAGRRRLKLVLVHSENDHGAKQTVIAPKSATVQIKPKATVPAEAL